MDGFLSVKSVALRRNCNASLHCNFEDSGAFDTQKPLILNTGKKELVAEEGFEPPTRGL